MDIKINKKGFTLVELLVVISIIGVLAPLVVTNLNEARARARDSRKKTDMAQLRTALQLYYNTYQKFPSYTSLNSIKGCGPLGTLDCPQGGCPGFAAGGTTGCDTVYMNALPDGLGTNGISYRSDNADKYCIKTVLDNLSDSDITTSHAGCASICSSLGVNLISTKEYAICAN